MSNLEKQNSESQLIAILTKSTTVELARESKEELKLLVLDMSIGLSMEKALSAPKLFQLKKSLGEPTLIKLLCVVLRSFCDSIKATRAMDTADIIECSELLIEKYSHDSVKDIILALKQAKLRGMNFYNSVSIATIFEIITEHMEKKSEHLEKKSYDEKSLYYGSVRTESNTRAAEVERRHLQAEKGTESFELRKIKAERNELEDIKNIIDKTIKKLEE